MSTNSIRGAFANFCTPRILSMTMTKYLLRNSTFDNRHSFKALVNPEALKWLSPHGVYERGGSQAPTSPSHR